MTLKKTNSSLSDLSQAIISALTPNLLKPQFRGSEHPLTGHCYVASEALYHLSDDSLKPMRARDDQGVVHWWLETLEGEILDLTAGQYYDLGRKPPYDRKRSGGFLTKEPSKRAQVVIQKVRKTLALCEG